MSIISRKIVVSRFHTFQNLNNYDIRKSFLLQNNINNIPNTNTQKNSSNTNIDDIFKMIIDESKNSRKSIDSYQSIKLLEIYIRKNRNDIDIITKKNNR